MLIEAYRLETGRRILLRAGLEPVAVDTWLSALSVISTVDDIWAVVRQLAPTRFITDQVVGAVWDLGDE